MESIAPPLQLIAEVKRSIEQGSTAKQGVFNYIKKNQDSFASQVTKWIFLIEQGQKADAILVNIKSTHRKCLLGLLERAFNGESIYQILILLEEETILACQQEQARFLARLPFYLMVPLLFFMFPAYLILLFGPLLGQFLNQLGGQP